MDEFCSEIMCFVYGLEFECFFVILVVDCVIGSFDFIVVENVFDGFFDIFNDFCLGKCDLVM